MVSHEQSKVSSMLHACNSSSHRARRRALSALPALVLGLMAAGCGDRYQLGETAQTLDNEESSPGLDSLAVMIVNRAEDTDGVTTHGDFRSRAIGDVDGDGYDDWANSYLIPQLVYGGPPGPAGNFVDADVSTTDFSSAGAVADGNTGWRVTAAGDVNGDGYADVFVSVTPRPWKLDRPPRAYLWYGGQGRPQQADLALEASEGFAIELTERIDLEAVGHGRSQEVVPDSVGDIDADGYADFGFSYGPSGSEETRTYVYYGGATQLPASGSAMAPAARLLGAGGVGALGDVDGDGYPEFQVRGPRSNLLGVTAASLVRGAAQRLAGDVDIFASATPIGAIDDMTLVQGAGDLDLDGCDDFVVTRRGYDDVATYLFHADLFYGGPALLNAPLDPELAEARFSLDRVPAELAPVGDWNGDGYADLSFRQSVRRGDEPCSECWYSDDPLWTGEARIIPGTSQRYSGSYATTTLRPDLALRDPEAPTGPTGFAPLGDIDADGFSDLLVVMGVPHSSRSYIKYGGPLNNPIY